jgi:adenine-specific DNA-methyltransferase
MTAPQSPATIQPIDKVSPEAQSANVVEGNLAQLKALFPEAFTEGRVDFEVLKQLLGTAVDEREEKYGLNWHGKRRARQLALTPSTGTLRPCPEESVDWDTTQNLLIEGDNLEVLKLLQKSYAGKVKLIYIDPPYNTGGDFVYPDNFQDSIKNYLELTGQVEGGQKISSNTDASGRFHTDWLNMMYPRLKLARSLMMENGLIFVSCDDNEVGNLRHLMHEIFGEENLVSQLVWKKSYGGGSKTKHVVILHEYILYFAKSKEALGRLELPPDPKALKYYKFQDSKFSVRGPFRLQPLATNSNDERENLRYALPYHGQEIWPEKQWQWEKSRALSALANDELVITRDGDAWSVNYKQYLRDEDGVERGAKPFSVLVGPYTQTGTSEFSEYFVDSKLFPFPKPTDLIRQLVQYVHPSTDFIFLDFFAGSGSSIESVLRLNVDDGGRRRVIAVQLPEPTGRQDYPSITDITKGRTKGATKALRASIGATSRSVDLGFRVFKLAQSNIRAWDPNPHDLSGTLLEHVEHLSPGRSEQDVLYELLLKLGLDLAVPMESRQIAGKTVHSIGAGALMACLSDGIDRDVAEPLALGIAAWQKAQAQALQGGDDNAKSVSTKLVFKDSAFADDVAKTNLAAILSQHGLDDVRSI